jgi:cell wall-associated NlpC family hydrolase
MRLTTPTPLAAAASLALAMLAGALVTAPTAAAGNPMPDDPIGYVWSVTAVTNGVELSGWAADPDDLTSNVTVAGYVDGRPVGATAVTSIARPRVARVHHTGPTPGFALAVPVGTGPHTVCLVVRGIGAGMDTVLDCVATPLGRTLSPTQLAAHSPRGAILRSRTVNNRIRVRGWATDPDDIGRRSVVVVYVDGAPAETLDTTKYSGTPPTGAGPRSAFVAVARTTTGAHTACVWVVNVGLGDNAFLGCAAVDTRGPAGSGPVPTPALNKAVVKEAKKHIGQPYVWGDEGPKAFDCSGLVMYSYGKNGYTTPRVSQDQFHAARVIPASRVVPGDLVFYHDSEGSVYHVGIYTRPGMSVAAIDPAEGVNWQSVDETSWSVSFGSFTHT